MINQKETFMKLVVLYTQPEDPEAFDKAYEHHKTLVANIPGLAETRITRFTRTLAGDGFYQMAEMIFPDKETLKTAMRSPEMAAVGADVQTFGAHLMTMMYGEEIG
jgi:uncharacterized protein (TIGR02118 family)